MQLLNKKCAWCQTEFITKNPKKKYHKKICERRFNASHYIVIRMEEYQRLKEIARLMEEKELAA